MEHAIWKGKIISASEIAEDFKVEKSIRVASRNKELLCPDPECQQPVLKYCHGDIKDPFSPIEIMAPVTMLLSIKRQRLL